MARMTTPLDTSRIVELDILLGKRGKNDDRAVRHSELNGLVEQYVKTQISTVQSIKSAKAKLAADVPMPTDASWVSGPSIVLAKGVWKVSADALFESGEAGTIAVRLFDGATALLGSQQSHPATASYYTRLSMSDIITLDATKTITLEAAPSIISATISMLAKQPSVGRWTPPVYPQSRSEPKTCLIFLPA